MIEEYFTVVRQVRIRYLAAGQGSPVFLLHSVSGTADGWQEFLRKVKLQNAFRFLAPDLPGFGGAGDFPSTGFSYDWYVDFLFDIHRSIPECNDTELISIGDSLGGILSLRLSLKYPRLVKKLVLLETPYFFAHQNLRYLANSLVAVLKNSKLSQRFVWRMMNSDFLLYILWKWLWSSERPFSEFADEDEIHRLRRVQVINIAQVVDEIVNTDMRNQLAQLKIPVLIISGAEDKWVPPYQSYQLQRELSNSKLVIIPEVHHGLLFNRPALILPQIEEFLLS